MRERLYLKKQRGRQLLANLTAKKPPFVLTAGAAAAVVVVVVEL